MAVTIPAFSTTVSITGQTMIADVDDMFLEASKL